MILAIVVLIVVYVLLFIIYKYILSFLFVILRINNSKILRHLNSTSQLLSALTIGISVFLYFQNELGPTNNIELKNFKFEKLISIKSPSNSNENKFEKEYYVLYSCEFTNNEDNIKNFKINSTLFLMTN